MTSLYGPLCSLVTVSGPKMMARWQRNDDPNVAEMMLEVRLYETVGGHIPVYRMDGHIYALQHSNDVRDKVVQTHDIL